MNIATKVSGSFALGVVLAAAPALASRPEQPVTSHIVSAGLFKNGLAVVNEEIRVSGPGLYRLEDPPIPLHGTWWVESDALVETLATVSEVEEPLPVGRLFDFQRSLAGRPVELIIRGEPAPVRGTVATIEPAPARRQWDRSYRQAAYSYWFGASYRLPSVPVENAPRSNFLVLERPGSRTSFIDMSTIARIDLTDDIGHERTQVVQRPALVFDVKDSRSPLTTIRISYLTKGIAWAPSYRVDLSDRAGLRLTQKAVIKNELEDLDDTEILLISGFPNVTFGHVTSPLSPATDWSTFFLQLNQRLEPAHAATLNVMTQQAVRFAEPTGGGALPEAGLAAEGLDLHYLSIGRRDLGEGDALALDTGAAAAAYERIVDWVVPDTRRPDGRQVEEYERQRRPDEYDDTPWDAVRFANPLDHPMSTGAAMIVEDGRFRGQTMSPFTNPGSEVTLRITRALSVTTRAVEHEEEGEREIVYVGGRTFRQVSVRGELSARNHRNEALTMVIRRRFSGELLEADGDPAFSQLEEGVYCVNRRNELVWTLEVQPGETVTLAYRYQVLVYH